MSLFGAGWTLGAIKHLAEQRATRATFYETIGWLGLMETEAGSPLPESFRSRPGQVFPMFHVFADVNEYRGGEVLPGRSTRPLVVDGFGLRLGTVATRPPGQLHAERCRDPGRRPGAAGANPPAGRDQCDAGCQGGSLVPGGTGSDPRDGRRRIHACAGPVRPRQTRHRVVEGPMTTSVSKPTIPDPARPLLIARAIRKQFAGVRALDGVDLEIRRGEVHAVVGENGAGKSTLMHILAGVHRPDARIPGMGWSGIRRLRRRT